MNKIILLTCLTFICVNPLFSQNSFVDISNAGLYKPQSIVVQYGNQTIKLGQESSRFEYMGQKRESSYASQELPMLKIKVISDVTYLNNHTVLQHQVALTSTPKAVQHRIERFSFAATIF